MGTRLRLLADKGRIQEDESHRSNTSERRDVSGKGECSNEKSLPGSRKPEKSSYSMDRWLSEQQRGEEPWEASAVLQESLDLVDGMVFLRAI